jgi:hypothetical protein
MFILLMDVKIHAVLERPPHSNPASGLNNKQRRNLFERMRNPESTSQHLACLAIHLPLAARFWSFLFAIVILLGLWTGSQRAFAQTTEWDPSLPAQPNPVIALDKADYEPGATANISGTGTSSFQLFHPRPLRVTR